MLAELPRSSVRCSMNASTRSALNSSIVMLAASTPFESRIQRRNRENVSLYDDIVCLESCRPAPIH